MAPNALSAGGGPVVHLWSGAATNIGRYVAEGKYRLGDLTLQDLGFDSDGMELDKKKVFVAAGVDAVLIGALLHVSVAAEPLESVGVDLVLGAASALRHGGRSKLVDDLHRRSGLARDAARAWLAAKGAITGPLAPVEVQIELRRHNAVVRLCDYFDSKVQVWK